MSDPDKKQIYKYELAGKPHILENTEVNSEAADHLVEGQEIGNIPEITRRQNDQIRSEIC